MDIGVANEINSPWENEIIADDAILYMRVHKSQFDPNGLILPRVFQNRGDGMSTDWNEYSTPEECQRRARKPSENAIIQLPVAGGTKN